MTSRSGEHNAWGAHNRRAGLVTMHRISLRRARRRWQMVLRWMVWR